MESLTRRAIEQVFLLEFAPSVLVDDIVDKGQLAYIIVPNYLVKRKVINPPFFSNF